MIRRKEWDGLVKRIDVLEGEMVWCKYYFRFLFGEEYVPAFMLEAIATKAGVCKKCIKCSAGDYAMALDKAIREKMREKNG